VHIYHRTPLCCCCCCSETEITARTSHTHTHLLDHTTTAATLLSRPYCTVPYHCHSQLAQSLINPAASLVHCAAALYFNLPRAAHIVQCTAPDNLSVAPLRCPRPNVPFTHVRCCSPPVRRSPLQFACPWCGFLRSSLQLLADVVSLCLRVSPAVDAVAPVIRRLSRRCLCRCLRRLYQPLAGQPHQRQGAQQGRTSSATGLRVRQHTPSRAVPRCSALSAAALVVVVLCSDRRSVVWCVRYV